MKRSNKFQLGGVFALLIGGGAYLNYLKAQPREQLSDLTLANLEAMALHLFHPVLGRQNLSLPAPKLPNSPTVK